MAERMTANFVEERNASSPVGSFSYSVRTPWRFNAGAAYTFGSFGLISFDYEGVDYTTMKMSERYDRWGFEEENEAIRHGSSDYNFRFANNFRAGAEIRIAALVLRGGYSYYGAPERTFEPTHIASGGLGLRGKQCFADLGVSYRFKESEGFSLYDAGDDQVPGLNTLSRLRFVLTFGVGSRNFHDSGPSFIRRSVYFAREQNRVSGQRLIIRQGNMQRQFAAIVIFS